MLRKTLFDCNFFKLKQTKTMLHKHITEQSRVEAKELLYTKLKNVYLLNLEK